jgi:manganese/zinc/iron transport system permease protein
LVVVNAVFLRVFYKELKISTFDPQLARSLGFSPSVLHYSLMALVAVTTVGAFSSVGAILSVALIIVPPVTASLLTYRLKTMIGLSLLIGAVCGLGGYYLATRWDVSISGMIATTLGFAFLMTFLFAPERGVIAQVLRRKRQRTRFLAEMLVVHLESHEGTVEEAEESRLAHLIAELKWPESQAEKAISVSEQLGWVTRDRERLALTEDGRRIATIVSKR